MARTTRSTGTAVTRRGTRPRPRPGPGGGPLATPQSGVLIVNMIPNPQSNEQNQDSEPNLSVNPNNVLQIAATAFTPDPNGSANGVIYFSTDGGNTWSLNAIVPGGLFGDITVRFADPTFHDPFDARKLAASQGFQRQESAREGGRSPNRRPPVRHRDEQAVAVDPQPRAAALEVATGDDAGLDFRRRRRRSRERLVPVCRHEEGRLGIPPEPHRQHTHGGHYRNP